MQFKIDYSVLIETFMKADQALINGEKIKFKRLNDWRKEFVPNFPGLYALFEMRDDTYSLLYIGETGNLRERMSDVCRTVNHTFRRQLGLKHFGANRTSKRFDLDVEAMLNEFFDTKLYVSFLEVNYGRTELEAFLVTQYQKNLLNSETKRKLKINLDKIDDSNLKLENL